MDYSITEDGYVAIIVTGQGGGIEFIRVLAGSRVSSNKGIRFSTTLAGFAGQDDIPYTAEELDSDMVSQFPRRDHWDIFDEYDALIDEEDARRDRVVELEDKAEAGTITEAEREELAGIQEPIVSQEDYDAFVDRDTKTIPTGTARRVSNKRGMYTLKMLEEDS